MADTAERNWNCHSWVVAHEPQKVVAYERVRGADTQPRAYVRVWNSKKRAWAKRSLKMSVRDESGNVDQDLVAVAFKRAGEIAKALRNGATVDALPVVVASADELTLEDGFNLAFRPYDPESQYSGKVRPTRHRADARRAAADVVRVLGPKKTWASLEKRDYARIWQRVADVRNGDAVWESKLKNRNGMPKQRRPGWQWCRIMLATLFSVGRWLEDEGRLPPKTLTIPHNWRGTLQEEWTKMTGESTRKSKPRYTVAELGRLWTALPLTDPRVRLGLTLGAELRIGQVIRVRRSNLDLSHVGAFGMGRLEVVGRGRKKGVVMDLTPEQRRVVDEMLNPRTGYLGKLEAAYLDGVRDDYPLFPQYVFMDGRNQALADVPDEVMHRRSFLRLFYRLEATAGVEHREGRGWYGIRRLTTDLAPEYTTDSRILNKIGGWTDTQTREDYQDEDNPEDASRAARVRRALRSDVTTKVTARLEGPRGEVLEHLVMAADAETLGALFRSLATVEPTRALDVLRLIRADGLKTVSAEEAWARLSKEDLLPLLQSSAPEVRSEALVFMTEVS